MGIKRINVIGEKYNLLTVIKEAEPSFSKVGHKLRKWECQCECGNKTIVRQADLRSGNTKSCGCRGGGCKAKHGHSKSYTYNSWKAMKDRCSNPKHIAFDRYGGANITVCDRWKNSFKAFLKDMGERPKGMSIDRINNDGNYESSNCRWATDQEQVLNRNTGKTFKNNKSGITGVRWNKANKKWEAFICKNYKQMYLGRFFNKEDAINARKIAEEKYHTNNK